AVADPVMSGHVLPLGEALARGRKPLQERCFGPVFRAIAFAVFRDFRRHLVKTQAIRMEHGPATINGEAIAMDPDLVDIAGAEGDSLLENACPFVDHGQYAAIDDLLRRELAGSDTGTGRRLADDFGHFGVLDRGAASSLISIEACAGLLAMAAHAREA